jgi:hypothetical protein
LKCLVISDWGLESTGASPAAAEQTRGSIRPGITIERQSAHLGADAIFTDDERHEVFTEYDHQGLDNRFFAPVRVHGQGPGRRRERQGGTLHFYYCEAA